MVESLNFTGFDINLEVWKKLCFTENEEVVIKANDHKILVINARGRVGTNLSLLSNRWKRQEGNALVKISTSCSTVEINLNRRVLLRR